MALAETEDDESLLQGAEELLSLSEAELAGMSHAQVLSSIAQFRSAISSVTSRLVALGDSAVQQQPRLPAGTGDQQHHAGRQAAALSSEHRTRESSVEPSATTNTSGPPHSLLLAPGAAEASDMAHGAQGRGAPTPMAAVLLPPKPPLPPAAVGNGDALLAPDGPQQVVDSAGGPALDGSTTQEEHEVDPSEWQVPPFCVPIHANVVTFNWPALYQAAQFDVVMMDPPWQLATANPTRGVALGYSQLCDQDIANIPVPQLQRRGGFLLVWVINAKYKWTLDQFERWGYRIVDEIVWVKMTVNRRLAKSHGYYLQHAKEVCLVGLRGDPPPGTGGGVASDVIFSMRRGNSQKPTEIYDLVEQLVPNGRYLEIFARKNNLRDYWVSLGNEVTGTGLPQEDLDAIREGMNLPGAVYGRAGVRAAMQGREVPNPAAAAAAAAAAATAALEPH